MTPRQLDSDVVAVHLRMIRDALDQMEELREATAAQLTAEPLTRAAVERFIQAIIDLAIDVNSHVAVTELGEAPRTGRASFEMACQLGAIDPGLADQLSPATGLRNILVRRYTEIDVARVTDAIVPVLDGFAAYVRQMAGYVKGRSETMPP